MNHKQKKQNEAFGFYIIDKADSIMIETISLRLYVEYYFSKNKKFKPFNLNGNRYKLFLTMNTEN